MIRSIAAALAAFALVSFGVRAEEAAKAAEAPKAEAAKEQKAEKKAEKKAKKEAKKKAKAEKKEEKKMEKTEGAAPTTPAQPTK